jgi:hypothetical protein
MRDHIQKREISYMPIVKLKIRSVSVAVLFIFLISGITSADERIINLEFARPDASGSDTSRTLQSLVKVRGIGEAYSTGGLYLMTHFGDREDLFQRENRELIDNPFVNQSWRYCSIFSASGGDTISMGRNWDNQNVGSIIVNLYRPPGGYASISFCRAIDMGFPLNIGLEQIASSELGNRLLLAPFYAMDGINEHGLAVAVAGVRHTVHGQKSGKKPVFISFLVRKILDGAKNIEEAVTVVEDYIPFLLDVNSLDGHLFLVDSSGKSVVLEYLDNNWKRIYGDSSWNVLTNKIVYEVPETDLKEKCWRYRSMSESLEDAGGKVGWKSGMNILHDVHQNGTTWSAVYSPTTKDIYFSVYQGWDTIYHIGGF